MPYQAKGIDYLRAKMAEKRLGVLKRYRYYDMHQVARDFGISTPPELKSLQAVLGWCAKAVDSLADRLYFREFRRDDMDLNAIYRVNNKDILFPSAIRSALISSCCFISISKDEDDEPVLQVIDGGDATGIIDETTNLLYEGYAVLKRDSLDIATMEAYYTPGKTEIYENGQPVNTYNFECDYAMLVPVIYKPDANRPFGHSRISRACMSITDEAMRTVKRSEIAAEFYSFPQKYVTGLSQDAEGLESWRAAMSAMMAFTKDDEGDSPKVGQFTQQSMQPHTEQLKMFAGLFAGETGLTMDDLGFASVNPSSSEAIKASHENLRAAGRRAMESFGTGFLNAGYLAACVRDDIAYKRKAIYDTLPIWEPIFEPDAATLSAIGDGAIKINQAIPNYFDATSLRDLTGIEPSSAAGIEL